MIAKLEKYFHVHQKLTLHTEKMSWQFKSKNKELILDVIRSHTPRSCMIYPYSAVSFIYPYSAKFMKSHVTYQDIQEEFMKELGFRKTE